MPRSGLTLVFDENIATESCARYHWQRSGADCAVLMRNASDPDILSATFSVLSLTLHDESPAGAVRLSQEDELRLSTALDYERRSAYSVVLRATDAGGLYVQRPVSVLVVDVNEARLFRFCDPTSFVDDSGLLLECC